MNRLMKAWGIALFCLFIPLCHARTQTAEDYSDLPNDSVPFAPLLHPSYFWITWPNDALYEGDVNLPVHLWSRTAALKYPDRVARPDFYDCYGKLFGKLARNAERTLVGSRARKQRATGCSLTFVPHFVLRQLSGGSAPVQTPTFNPAFEWTRWSMYLDDTATVEARRSLPGGAWRSATLTGLHLRAGHYSNGQTGCLFENQDPETCETIPGEETLNKTNGSFSTHYVEPVISFARVRFDSTGHERRLSSLTLAMRHNIHGLSKFGGMSDELARTYGWNSFSASYVMRRRAEHSFLFGWQAVVTLLVEGECAPSRPDPYQACRGAAGLSLSLPAMYGFGVGARYVAGWDYYNVGYGDNLRNWRGGWPMLGIVLDHTVPLTIRR